MFLLTRESCSLKPHSMKSIEREVLEYTIHEIGNSIGALQLNISLLEQAHGDKKKFNQLLGSSKFSVEVTTRILEDVRTFLSNHHDPFQSKTFFCLKDLTREVTELFSGDHNCKIQSSLEEGQAFLDKVRIAQALLNLLQNSKSHCEGKTPEIKIVGEVTGEFYSLRLTDNGSGIPKDKWEFVFKKNAKSSKSSGFGMGLFLARKFIQMSGGTISIMESGDSGTTFEVKLPLFLETNKVH